MNKTQKTSFGTLVRKYDSLTFLQKASISVCAITLGIAGMLSIGSMSEHYTCDSGGQTVVVNSENNTLWAIANRYCEGSIAQAVNVMVEQYGPKLQIGQIIVLPQDESGTQDEGR
jgi:hypothetical protein